jgi:hypothetical protein
MQFALLLLEQLHNPRFTRDEETKCMLDVSDNVGVEHSKLYRTFGLLTQSLPVSWR